MIDSGGVPPSEDSGSLPPVTPGSSGASSGGDKRSAYPVPPGEGGIAPPGVSDPDRFEQEDTDDEEAREEAKKILSRGEEAKWLAYMVLLLLIVTAIVGGSNWYRLKRSASLEGTFHFRALSALNEPVTFGVKVNWHAMPAAVAPPETMIDGRRVSMNRTIQITPTAGKSPDYHEFGIGLGKDQSPGRYEGIVRFTPLDDLGAGDVTGFEFPVTVVVPGLFGEWSLLITWLLAAGSVLLLLYLTMLHLHPLPKGVLEVRYLTEHAEVLTDYLDPKCFFRGLFRPLSRSLVRIDRLVSSKPWGKAIYHSIPSVCLEFTRIAPFSRVLVLSLIEEGVSHVRRLPVQIYPHPNLELTDGYPASVFSFSGAAGEIGWFVLWIPGNGEDRKRWVAIRHSESLMK